MLCPLLTPIVLEDSLPSWPFGSKQPWWEGLEARGCGWAKPTTSKKRLVRHQFNSQQETLSNDHMNLDVYPHLVTLFKLWPQQSPWLHPCETREQSNHLVQLWKLPTHRNVEVINMHWLGEFLATLLHSNKPLLLGLAWGLLCQEQMLHMNMARKNKAVSNGENPERPEDGGPASHGGIWKCLSLLKKNGLGSYL